jgi:hypothetical protein
MDPKTFNKIAKLLSEVPPPQGIFRRHEIPIADFLLGFKEDLIKEFLEYHTDFLDGDFVKGTPTSSIVDVDKVKTSHESWKVTRIKYDFNEDGVHHNYIIKEEVAKHFPTAMRLTEEFGDDCPISSYSILEANSVIRRHTGVENRTGEFIRIHIPLIVPPGEIFFEVNGEEIDWSDIFAFDNQQVHSAYNRTPHRRLVYLIDLRRSRIGMPPGVPYNPFKEYTAKPFIRDGVQLT